MDKLGSMEAFAAVVARGGFAAAGRALGLPASSVTRRVQALEESLGTRLLHRTTRSVHLTEEGEVYHERCLHILDEVARAEETVGSAHEAPGGTLRVQAPPGFAVHGLTSVVVAYLEQYPDADAEIIAADVLGDFHAERLDVAIVAGEPPRDESLVAETLVTGRGLLAASPSYLDRRGRPESLEDLEEHDFVAPPPELLGIQVAPGRSRLISASEDVLHRAALAGVGIGLLPYFLVREDLDARRLESVEVRGLTMEGTVFYVVPRRAVLPARTRVFVGLLRRAFSRS